MHPIHILYRHTLLTQPFNTPIRNTISTHSRNIHRPSIIHRFLSIYHCNQSHTRSSISLFPSPLRRSLAISIQALVGALFFPASRVTVEHFTPLTPLGSFPGVLEFTMNVTFIVTVTCEPSSRTYCMTANDVNNAVYSLSEGVSFTYPRALQVRQHPTSTPYQYILSTQVLNTPYQYILSIHPQHPPHLQLFLSYTL